MPSVLSFTCHSATWCWTRCSPASRSTAGASHTSASSCRWSPNGNCRPDPPPGLNSVCPETGKGAPLAVGLKDCPHAVVPAKVPYTPHTEQRSSGSQSLLVVNRSEMAAALRVLESIEPPKEISMMGGRDITLPTDGYCWDSVVLNASLERFVRQDFESFFRREEWFRRHNLPYRRGYLLYGPPGNGKTTVARIMACHPAIRAFGVDFRTAKYRPDQLSDMFDAAAAQAPSLVILEDIDKVGTGDPDTMQIGR